MRFLKNILLAAALSLACISCEDKGVNPISGSRYLEPGDLIGADIGVNIVNPNYRLQTIHNDIFIYNYGEDWPEWDYYYYGFFLYLPIDDYNKRDTVKGISITLIDADSKSRWYYIDISMGYSYSNSGFEAGYQIDLLSPQYQNYDDFRMVSFLSPEYICKVRLYNSRGDSSRAAAFKITANYIQPETFFKRWVNQNELNLQFSATTSWHYTRSLYGEYYRSDKSYAPFNSSTFSLSSGQRSVTIKDIPGEAENFSIRIYDNYKGIRRYYAGKIEPLGERNFVNLDTLNFAQTNFIKYLHNSNKIFAGSLNGQTALIDPVDNSIIWKDASWYGAAACDYDEVKEMFYVGYSDGMVISHDPNAQYGVFLFYWDKEIKTISASDNYLLLTTGKGEYAIYDLTDKSLKNGRFEEIYQYNQNDKLKFIYNSSAKRAYMFFDEILYSYSIDFISGVSTLVNRVNLYDYASYWGGGNYLFLNPEKDELILSSGAIYTCAADSSADLRKSGHILPLNSITWSADKRYYITTRDRTTGLPPSVYVWRNQDGKSGERVDLAGKPLIAIKNEEDIKVFTTLENGSLAIQTFELDEIINN